MIRPWYALPFSRALCASMVLAIPSGCGLDQRPGDGLVTDGRQVYVQPSNPVDAAAVDALPAGDDGGEAPFCKRADLFVEKVVPQFERHCVECHDGTKLKALVALAMSSNVLSNPELACRTTLARGATPEDVGEAEILTSSDPARPDVEHEFKFEDNPADFTIYRDEVLVWLEAEKGL